MNDDEWQVVSYGPPDPRIAQGLIERINRPLKCHLMEELPWSQYTFKLQSARYLRNCQLYIWCDEHGEPYGYELFELAREL